MRAQCELPSRDDQGRRRDAPHDGQVAFTQDHSPVQESHRAARKNAVTPAVTRAAKVSSCARTDVVGVSVVNTVVVAA